MKVRAKELTDKERITTLDALYTAAASVHGREATKLFLRDLLTESERIMLGRRIIIARLLLSGTTYDDIALRLGVGNDTIARIDKWLSDKAPGYETAIAGLNAVKARRAQRGSANDFAVNPSWQNAVRLLKKKYPLHFLLFPWPKSHE